MSEKNAQLVRRVLVIGGSGNIGRPVVRYLQSTGIQVGVGTRRPESMRNLFPESVSPVLINMQSVDSIQRALEGWEAVHLNLPSGPRFQDCHRNEYLAVKNFVQAADSSLRVSYLSGSTVSEAAAFPPARAKWQAEEELRASGLQWTIWRATWFMEALELLYRFGVIVRPGAGESRVRWLAGADFGRFVYRGLNNFGAVGKTLYAYGPQKRSFKEAVEVFRKFKHKFSPIVSLPIGFMSAVGGIANRRMWFGAQMLRHLAEDPEPGEAGLTDVLVGLAATTLEEYLSGRTSAFLD